MTSLGIVLIPNVVEKTPPYVDRILPNTPADEAGLMPDDLGADEEEDREEHQKSRVKTDQGGQSDQSRDPGQPAPEVPDPLLPDMVPGQFGIEMRVVPSFSKCQLWQQDGKHHQPDDRHRQGEHLSKEVVTKRVFQRHQKQGRHRKGKTDLRQVCLYTRHVRRVIGIGNHLAMFVHAVAQPEEYRCQRHQTDDDDPRPVRPRQPQPPPQLR